METPPWCGLSSILDKSPVFRLPMSDVIYRGNDSTARSVVSDMPGTSWHYYIIDWYTHAELLAADQECPSHLRDEFLH